MKPQALCPLFYPIGRVAFLVHLTDTGCMIPWNLTIYGSFAPWPVRHRERFQAGQAPPEPGSSSSKRW